MQRILPSPETATILPHSLAPLSKKVRLSETEADDSEGRLPLLFLLEASAGGVRADFHKFTQFKVSARDVRGPTEELPSLIQRHF